MKATQILYLLIFVGILFWIVTSSHVREGFESSSLITNSKNSEPVIPKGLAPTSIKMETMPNPSTLDTLPFGPYSQMASVGSFQYKDPAMFPAELVQMKKLNEDIRSFLVFEGVNLAKTSDPAAQLPLTQLRADSRKLQEEIAVLDKNPGIDSQLTQQDLADIEGVLTFLQKKVRLFETSGLTEGFQNPGQPPVKTKATRDDLVLLQKRIYAAILTLSASGTRDPVVQARIQALQKMYTAITDMITKINKGQLKPQDITLYKEDINEILPNLAKPASKLNNIFNQSSGKQLSPVEKEIATIVGEEHAPAVFNNLMDKGMFRVNIDLGYNVSGSAAAKGNRADSSISYSQASVMQPDGSLKPVPFGPEKKPQMTMDSAYDSTTPGMDDRADSKKSSVARFDWKKRVETICEQIKLRGLDPLDFGCIPKDSLMSPAYSWRGHAKMICGRLAATMDPGLPVTCGCPPTDWKGWNLSV